MFLSARGLETSDRGGSIKMKLLAWRKLLVTTLIILIIVVILHLRWRLGLWINRVPQMHNIPVTTLGYTIQQIPFYFGASFVRGHDVYLVDGKGWVYKGDDRRRPQDVQLLGDSKIPGRLLFVSSRGTIFVSGDNSPMVRSMDGGKTWEKIHDWSFWRMAEDEESHTLYAGNYTPKKRPVFIAKVFKSNNEGRTWHTIFEDGRLDHIHSIQWDTKYRNLYITAGDGSHRGQAYSADYGNTWHWINSGGKQGHTDVAISERYVLWGTDDNLGRVLRAPRQPVRDGRAVVWQPDHHVWWIVAHRHQIYAGTFTSRDKREYSGAFLIASNNEGETWQRLLVEPHGNARLSAFMAESRRLSADGWLYCATTLGRGFRIRCTLKVANMAGSSN